MDTELEVAGEEARRYASIVQTMPAGLTQHPLQNAKDSHVKMERYIQSHDSYICSRLL
jgi:hypothetical protein